MGTLSTVFAVLLTLLALKSAITWEILQQNLPGRIEMGGLGI